MTVATAARVLPVIAASMAELMTEALAETDAGTIARQDIAAIVQGKTILALGPGLTTHEETSTFVREVVRDATLPVVLDADAPQVVPIRPRFSLAPDAREDVETAQQSLYAANELLANQVDRHER